MSDTNFKDIKVIGFDLDQTLYPKSPEIDAAIQKYIYEKISKRLNIDLENAEKKFNELYQAGRGLSGRKSLITLGFPEKEAENIVQEALENADIAKFLKPNRRLIELLVKLSKKYAIDIITGSRNDIVLKKLESLNIDADIFRNLVTNDDASKSDGSAYKLWLSKYPQYFTEEFLYIGDRPRSDYEAPKSLGIKSILVNIKEADPNVGCLQLKDILEIEILL